jgi:thimet oligopeptidase
MSVGAAELVSEKANEFLHPWTAGTDAAGLEAWVDTRLEDYQKSIDEVLAVAGPRTIENTLRPFDRAQTELATAGQQACFR